MSGENVDERATTVEGFINLCIDFVKDIENIAVLKEILNRLGTAAGVPVVKAARAKMSMNRKKYPVEECKRSAVVMKYTAYTYMTGVTEDDNNNMNVMNVIDTETGKTTAEKEEVKELTLLREEVRQFAEERGWLESQYPMVRVKGCVIAEVGELLDIVNWKESKRPMNELDTTLINKIAGELADILIYLIHYERVTEEDTGCTN